MTGSSKRNLLFGLIATVALFVIVELVLRIAYNFSSEYIARRENINHEYRLWQMHLFNSFQGMNEPDPDLFWRLKPGYRSTFISVNSSGFAGPEVALKTEGEYRVLFLGDSTPLGLGLAKADLSFVRLLEDLLAQRVSERFVSVVNASVAGYTSWQCWTQLRLRGAELNPDLVIAYFGNNDPSLNGYLSDRELYERTRRSTWINRFLSKSYLYQLLKGLVLSLKTSAITTDTELVPRVSLHEARENLDSIAHWCQTNGSDLILCTVPTPDLWPPGIQFKVFAQGKDSEGRLVMSDQMQNKLDNQWDLCLDTTLLPGLDDIWAQRVYQTTIRESASPEEAIIEIERLLKKNPNDPLLWNNYGVNLWRQELDADSAFEMAIALDSANAVPFYNAGVALYRVNPMLSESLLKHAKELDNYSLRIKAPYNDNYRRFCESHDASLAELEVLFTGLPENEYFIDHCHPTQKGHELIAGELVNVVVTLIK